MAPSLKEQQLKEVVEYLNSKEVESIDDIRLLKGAEFDSLLEGITPEPRRAKVRKALSHLGVLLI